MFADSSLFFTVHFLLFYFCLCYLLFSFSEDSIKLSLNFFSSFFSSSKLFNGSFSLIFLSKPSAIFAFSSVSTSFILKFPSSSFFFSSFTSSFGSSFSSFLESSTGIFKISSLLTSLNLGSSSVKSTTSASVLFKNSSKSFSSANSIKLCSPLTMYSMWTA